MNVVNDHVLKQTTDAIVTGVKGDLNLIVLFMEHVYENIKSIYHSPECALYLSLSDVVSVPLACSTYHSSYLLLPKPSHPFMQLLLVLLIVATDIALFSLFQVLFPLFLASR